ncbi:unnamed protein product [Cuscuta campestris]|uniref:Uncharacterized protein n=1 Tax=Cuscuta campestris TaxID=132261 RepID=A0A484NCU6_9ASTE|nr:unnamed protein product [Cuscuta campestris]
MSRCHSDSSMLRGKSTEETFSSINRFGEGKTLLLLLSRDGGKGLQKTPSLPPIVTTIIKQDSDHKAETNEPIFPEPLRNNLLRAPSLPVFAGTEDDDDDVNVDDDDDESDFCMGKLIRQASLNQSKLLLRQTSFNHPRFLPPRQTPKGVIRSCNISTLGSKKPEPEIIASISGTDSEERKSNCVQNNLKTRKGHSGQDIDNDSQGFKNLGLNCHDEEKLPPLKSFHVRLMSIVLDVDVEPSTTPWDVAKAYLFVPISGCESVNGIDWDLVENITKTDAWRNPLQRARPDVYLGTNEQALGGDRTEYGFGKLRNGLAFGVKSHHTYGIRVIVKRTGTIKTLASSFTGILRAGEVVVGEVVDEVVVAGPILVVAQPRCRTQHMLQQ